MQFAKINFLLKIAVGEEFERVLCKCMIFFFFASEKSYFCVVHLTMQEFSSHFCLFVLLWQRLIILQFTLFHVLILHSAFLWFQSLFLLSFFCFSECSAVYQNFQCETENSGNRLPSLERPHLFAQTEQKYTHWKKRRKPKQPNHERGFKKRRRRREKNRHLKEPLMPLLVDGEMKEKKWCGQTDTFLTHKEKEAGLQKSESARDEEGKGGWGWWGEVRGREEREEEVPVNVVLKQWWIFTPLHLSPPSCVCVSGDEGGRDRQQWMCQHLEQFKQDTLRYGVIVVALDSAARAALAAGRTWLGFLDTFQQFQYLSL